MISISARAMSHRSKIPTSQLSDKERTGAKVANFPRSLAIPLMKLAYALGLSPLGPYQYKMIAENFIFDTRK